MKKNITIGILILVSVVALIFGFYQKHRVDKLNELTIRNIELSNELYQTNIRLKETENRLKEMAKVDSLKLQEQLLISQKMLEIAQKQKQLAASKKTNN